MPHEVTCPDCGHRLRIPAGVVEQELTCPRCLAPFANPDTAVSGHPTRSDHVLRPAPDWSVQRQVQADWRYFHLTLLGVVVLSIVAIFLLASIARAGRAGGPSEVLIFPLMALFALLDVVVLVWIGVPLFRRLARPSLAPAPYVARLLGGLVLFWILAIAVVAFLFFACAVVVMR